MYIKQKMRKNKLKRLINIRKNLSGHRTYFLTFLITYFLGGVISALICFIKSQISDFDVYDIIQVITGFLWRVHILFC